MSTKPSEFQYVFETSISDDARVPNDIPKSLKNEVMKSVNNGQYSSLLHLCATANAFNRPIVTIFPQVHNIVINREVHNQFIRPVGFSEGMCGPSMYIMWTHTSNTNEQMWRPNHFVSCHVIDDTKPSNQNQSSCGQPPLKKQKKVSDFFPSETKDNEPPSADAQSQEHTDQKTESSENIETETADDKNADHQTDTEFHSHSSYELGDIVNGTIPLSSLSDLEKISIAESNPDPETLKDLPYQTKQFAGKSKEKKLYFQTSWLDKHKWLSYSSVFKGGLGKVCVLFPQSGFRCYDTFFSKPFTNFKKAVGKDGSLEKHDHSEYHRNACISYQTLKASLQTPENTVQYKINVQNKDMYDKNCRLLTMIVKSINLCGKQNLSLRGHRDDSTSTSSNKGNFLAILKLLAGHDKELTEHIEKTPKNAKYTSKTIQNQLIDIIGQNIRKQVLDGLTGKGFYSIIADEVTNKFSNQEVLALCLRFVDESETEPCIREEFF